MNPDQPQTNTPPLQDPNINNVPLAPTTSPQPALNQPQPAQATAHSNPTIIVLQWLTYAFWGWTVLIMSILTTMVINNFAGTPSDNNFSAYAVAAVLVLLPISVACDVIYSKHEPQKKTGAASIVMVIHAVLFALFGIGSLIGAVISVVIMLTNSSDSTGSKVALYSLLIVFVLYVATFLRTINPSKLPWIKRFYAIFMVVTVGIVAVLGIVGPAAVQRSTRNDRLINDNLYSLSETINTYASNNNSLPNSLSQLNVNGDVKKLVDDNLIDYKPNTKQSTLNNNYDSSTYGNITLNNNTLNKTFYYQLCVTYKKASKDSSSYSSHYQLDNGYSTNPDTSNYQAGNKCYDLQTSGY